MRARWMLLAVAVAGAGVVALWGLARGLESIQASATLDVQADRLRLPANGAALTRITLRAKRPLSPRDVRVEVVEGRRRARVEYVVAEGDSVLALVRAGVEPGPVVVEARAKGSLPARLRLETLLDPSDRAGDGTPDFLRLDDTGDRRAFRVWFTFLAEAQALKETRELPVEINDCAALLRFAYREALREHDGEWASDLRLPMLPQAPSVKKYAYPYTPLGAGLFRVRPGAFRAEDPAREAFAQFADAETLRLRNTHPVSRDVRDAEPGDLLFYRQLEQDLPFHAMIFLGPSQLEAGVHHWVVYHTGPMEGTKGEIRRVRVEDLLQHPSPRWRPVPGNANFLGVYRWNILRRD